MSCLKSFDFVNGFSVEYMHCALLGVSKLLLNLWTNPARCRGTSHDLRSDIPYLDRCLGCVHVPSLIRRKPRGISDSKHWKGILTIIMMFSFFLCSRHLRLFYFCSIRIQIMDSLLCYSHSERCVTAGLL